MTWSRVLLMCCVVCSPLPAIAGDREAVDLKKIDRSVAKEPEYSKSPRYCLLVFGPKAETRVWLVMDGKTLYVDRNGNGDLTEADEAVANEERYSYSYDFPVGTITSQTGRTYQNLRVSRTSSSYSVWGEVPGKGTQRVGLSQVGHLRFSTTAQNAPIVHFDGPLSITQYSDKRVISRNGAAGNSRAQALRIMVGTPGLGEGTFVANHCKICDSHGELSAKFEYRSNSGGPQVELTEPLLKIG